jgi:hypothetical protein
VADGTVGGNWWGLRFHNRDGGFYKHSDRDSQFEDLNWPGFTDPRGDLPEIARERELLGILREYAGRITGTTPVAPVIPDAPTLLPAPDVGHLSWQGSTGASEYEIQRAPAAAGPWTSLAAGLGDHLATYTPLFCDTTAQLGGTYFYRVIARNSAGASAPSNVLGPLRPDRLWLVDDLLDRAAWAPASANLEIDKAYAHTPYLEDIAVVHRRDAAAAGRLVYRLPGPVRSFMVTAFDTTVAPRFYLTDPQGTRTEVVPRITAYQQGKRARYAAELPANQAVILEMEIPANAAPHLAFGRVEISWIPSP